MPTSKIKITSAPSEETWYASHVGRKFRVIWECSTHFEVIPNAKKWPQDVCLLVPVEDCAVVKQNKGYLENSYENPHRPSLQVGGKPWWYYNMSTEQQSEYDLMSQISGEGSYRRY